MKIGLFGFGRAGRAVAAILLQSKEAQLSWVIRKSTLLQHRSVPEFLGIGSDEPGLIFSAQECTCNELLEEHPVDVIVDFSSPEGIFFYGKQAAERGVAVVSAISQYSAEKIRYIKEISRHTKILWSPNITIGINFLMVAAKILKNIAPHSDIEIIEEHFRDKKEVSGTARKIANALHLNHAAIKTIRAGGIVGRHEILFGFPYQTVRLMHESISRDAFGNGALFAAKNIVNKENGLYSMEDLLIPYFKAFS
jgi:4-hydroxy-tetrahydrodipicolinate reductase